MLSITNGNYVLGLIPGTVGHKDWISPIKLFKSRFDSYITDYIKEYFNVCLIEIYISITYFNISNFVFS